MSEDEVEVLLSSVHGLWGKALSDEQIAAWKMTMARWDFEVMMSALGRYSEVSPSYPPNPLELTALARSIVSERKAIGPTSTCDGSSWIDDPTLGTHPCPACNPYLWDVFGDAGKWLLYLAGTRLDKLHPDVRYNERDKTLVVDLMPLPCDPDYAPIDAALGTQVAREAYRQECERLGKPYDKAWVESTLGTVNSRENKRERAIANIKLGPTGEALKRLWAQPHDPAEPRTSEED